MHTHTNVVSAGFLKRRDTLWMVSFITENLSMRSSRLGPWFPNNEVIWLSMLPIDDLRLLMLSRDFSMMVGKDRRRRVCPVGAVSKTTTSYSMFWTCSMSCENDMASSIPGSWDDTEFSKSPSFELVSSLTSGSRKNFLKSANNYEAE